MKTIEVVAAIIKKGDKILLLKEALVNLLICGNFQEEK